MKSPFKTPTADDLRALGLQVAEGQDDNQVGLVVGERVLWVSLRHTTLTDEHLSQAVIARERRMGRLGPTAPATPPSQASDLSRPDYTPKEFQAGDVATEPEPDPLATFDMGRAEEKPRKVLGADDLPPFLDGMEVTGKVRAHEIVEGVD